MIKNLRLVQQNWHFQTDYEQPQILARGDGITTFPIGKGVVRATQLLAILSHFVSQTTEAIEMQLGIIDYVGQDSHRAKLVTIGSVGTSR